MPAFQNEPTIRSASTKTASQGESPQRASQVCDDRAALTPAASMRIITLHHHTPQPPSKARPPASSSMPVISEFANVYANESTSSCKKHLH